MTRWTKTSRLRFAVLGIGLGFLLAVGSGCPTVACPNCKIKRAEFSVGQTPRNTEIVQVTVSATGQFTDHCPDPESRSSCTLSDTFTSSSTSVGAHQVRLDGWSFDDDDTVTATATVVLRDVDGGSAPSPLPIPASAISFVTM